MGDSGRALDGAAAVGVAYCGSSWAVPGSETAPGPGRSPAASTVALKVGRMQKMLTSVEACPAPSLRLPAGAPVSVIVRAPPPAGPKAPGFRCSQSGHEPLPSVQAVGEPLPMKHGLGAVWSQLPAPTPVQQLNGLPAPMPPLLDGP